MDKTTSTELEVATNGERKEAQESEISEKKIEEANEDKVSS